MPSPRRRIEGPAGRWSPRRTRILAYAFFLVVAWPLLTLLGTAATLTRLPYYTLNLGRALAAAAVGIYLTLGDLVIVGGLVFSAGYAVFRTLGRTDQAGFLRFAIEPVLMWLAIVCGVSLWYPAVVSQPLFDVLASVPVAGVTLLLATVVTAGARLVGGPGRWLHLAAALLAIGALGPVPLRLRAALEGTFGHPPALVILGLDSISHADDLGEFQAWTREQDGSWYDYPVAPGLLTNAVWTSILTGQPVRTHGVFHGFQAFPANAASLLNAARAQGYRTTAIFPDQLTCAVGSQAGFDDDRSGPIGWRQLLLPIVANNSILLPLVKPLLPRWGPAWAPSNHAGTFTYDIRRELRGILSAGSAEHRTLVTAHLTYPHLPAYPGTVDLTWGEWLRVLAVPAGMVRDRTLDWQHVDERHDPLPIRDWKVQHLLMTVASEVERAQYLKRGGQLVVFSDHGDRTGLTVENFHDPRYHRVLLATFGLAAPCVDQPISLIDIGTLTNLFDRHADPSVEFTLAPPESWSRVAAGSRLRWSGSVEFDPQLLREVFRELRRHDPWSPDEPMVCGRGRRASAGRHEPEVLRIGPQVLPHDDVAARGEVLENRLAHLGVRLDADERRRESLDREPREGLRLVQLDVHRQEVELLDPHGRQQIVERDRRARDRALDLGEAVGERTVGGREKSVAADEKRSLLVRPIRDEQWEEPGPRAVPAVVLGELLEGIDGQPTPAQRRLEVIGVAAVAVVAGTDVDEHAPSPVREEVADEQLFLMR